MFQRLRHFSLGSEATAPCACGVKNRLYLTCIRAGLLDVGQDRSAIIENHRSRRGDAALDFGRRKPPARFGVIRSAVSTENSESAENARVLRFTAVMSVACSRSCVPSSLFLP